jgi:hypothetical protein
MDCKHDYQFVKIESCLLDGSREQVDYYTRQCGYCGLVPASDFRRYRMRPDECITCGLLIAMAANMQKKIRKGKLKGTDKEQVIAAYKKLYLTHNLAYHPERMLEH